jgi:aspartate racemase
MKRIGMLGGMSWESTLEYYRILNEQVRELLGSSHSMDCILYSFDFYEIEQLQAKGQWTALTQLLVQQAIQLKSAGAQAIVICTNTMHVMADDIAQATQLPVIHIAEATAQAISQHQIKRVLLLGTKYTMEGTFYRDYLSQYEIDMIIPDPADRQIIHDIIYQELVVGVLTAASKQAYLNIINKAIEQGVTGVILGCTEIPLLIKAQDVRIAVFDTTAIHAQAAVAFALQ